VAAHGSPSRDGFRGGQLCQGDTGHGAFDNGGAYSPFAEEAAVSGASSLYHTLCRELAVACGTVRQSSRHRLALLITTIIASRSCVIAELARKARSLGLTTATPASTARRLRRTMNDPQLTAAACYGSLVGAVLARALPRGRPAAPLLVVIDESTHTDHVHLLRAALVYRGGTIPLAWATWSQNTALAEGAYWAAVDRLFAAVATRLPAGPDVVIVADRVYAVPSFIDRVTASGWHWLVRVTTSGSHRWCPRLGHPTNADWGADMRLAHLVQQALPGPGTRVRASGRFAKKAGWRAANLIGSWGQGQREPLVVLTDLPPRWLVLAWYRRRFWVEPGFRGDKSGGWNWEKSQVRDPAHHAVLLLALAWATLLSLWAGTREAARQLDALRTSRRRPTHARLSLATLGREELTAWLFGHLPDPPRRRIPWRLPDLFGPAWSQEWSACLARHFIFAAPVRP
jgi:Transposase DDE domain